jgi:cytochrome c-type biogenesis protein CcmF
VHSFAQSDIGTYFAWFMGFIVAACVGLINCRLPLLRGTGRIESLLSREAAFVVNNWALVGAMSFIAVATTWPLVTEFFQGQQATVGPPFYNRWMAPIGIIILALMGAAPLFGWRKTSEESLKKAFRLPTIVMGVTIVLHLALGKWLGFPAYVVDPPTYKGIVGDVVQQIAAVAPLVTVALVAFNFAVVYQEFHRGVAARLKNAKEDVFTALITLVRKSRRRYGGYIVHIGIGLMYLGFCGKSWEVEREASLLPGQSSEVGGYTLTYRGSRRETDMEKMMIFADLDVQRGGKTLPSVHPAKFIYNESNMGPTTEVSQLNGFRDDLYTVLGQIDTETKRATFRIHVNPLVAWIWIGVLVLIGGAAISLWPDVSLKEVGAWNYVRASAGLTSSIMFAILLASSSASAVQSDREVLSRERQEQLLVREQSLARSDAAQRAADGTDQRARAVSLGVTRNAGFSLFGGLLVGATVAWAVRNRREALAR